MYHLLQAHSETITSCRATLGLLPQIKVQAILRENVTSDSCTMSLLHTRVAGEGLYVMITKQQCLLQALPMQADLGGSTCQVLQMNITSWLPKQTSSPGVQPRFASPLSIAGRKEGNL